jgi:hypothetical protein
MIAHEWALSNIPPTFPMFLTIGASLGVHEAFPLYICIRACIVQGYKELCMNLPEINTRARDALN